MADLQENEMDFEKIVREVEIGIKDLSKNKRGIEARGGAELLKNRLTRAKQILRSYKLDFRELPKTEQKPYQDKANQYEEQIKTLENDLNWAEKNSENGGGSNNNNNNGQSTIDTEYQEIMQKAKKTQLQDIDTTHRILQEVNQINEVGTSTLEEMAVQEDQMKRIQKDMEEIDGNLKLATRQMRAFARKMATDKIIMGLVLLIVAAIIFVIVYSIVKPKSKTVQQNVTGSTN
ncbi:hypothetical protein RB653_000744 [Dictyostelium firmibasis]|uniref:t-SNARE coiled-coil homology domain-containing protein n=1 Tax=Dictyostelium firmibasis TaxID=79012 RepID=A0AAN7U398_9MYCE